MAKIEIKKRTLNFIDELKWRYLLRTEIIVPWPAGYVGPDRAYSADPNRWWRSWLEENVGKQGKTWNWRAHYGTDTSIDRLILRFRYEKDAVSFLITHG